MMQTTDDLRSIMERASSEVPSVSNLAAVARRRSARRTIGATGVGVAAALVAVAMGGFVLTHRPVTTSPAGSQQGDLASTDAPAQALMPDLSSPGLQQGAALFASKTEVGPQGVSLTFEVPRYDVGYGMACESPQVSDVVGSVNLLVNGELRGRTTNLGCNYGFPHVIVPLNSVQSWGDPPKPGELVTLTWKPNDPNRFDPDTKWMIALYRPIPIEAFDFPEQPAQLESLPPLPLKLSTGGQGPGTPTPLAEGSNAAATGDTTTTYRDVPVNEGVSIVIEMKAPGQITVSAGGKPAMVTRSWDYDGTGLTRWLSPADLGVRPGGTVDLTVTTARFPPETVAWTAYDQSRP
jgi:hypothetical protein